MTVSEGGGRRALSRKFQDVYLPSLKANYMVWPAVQVLNFRVIPLQFQIVFILVRSLRGRCKSLTIDLAIRINRWNRLDSVPFVDQLLGGSKHGFRLKPIG